MNYMKDYYQILGVSSDASHTEIKSTYKKLPLKIHPDKNPIKTKEAELQFMELQEAYDVLKNDETRQDYNNNYQNPSFALFRSFVTQKSISIAEVLSYLNKGASVDAHNAFNQTLLMYAANRANFDMVEFLVKNNASINAVDGAVNTPLMYTAIKKSVHFSADNAEIIKERNQKYFNDSTDDQQEPSEKSSEHVVEELDITKTPVMSVLFKIPGLKSLWESIELAIEMSDMIATLMRQFSIFNSFV